MFPVLAKVGPVTLYAYGALLVGGFLASTWWAARAARLGPRHLYVMTPEQVVDCACLMLVCGILGGRLFFIALNWRAFLAAPAELIAIWHGGLVFYGGLLGGLAAAWWHARRRRLDLLRAFDQMTPFAVLGHAFGRLGCFLNGCCYGKPTEWWCGVQFPGHMVPVWPTQLMEAIGLALLAMALRRWQHRGGLARRGAIFAGYLIGYGLLRLALEFVRGDKAPIAAGLTLQQVISLGAVATGVAFLVRSKAPAHGAQLPVSRRHR